MTDIQREKYSISRPLKPLINTWFSKDDTKVLILLLLSKRKVIKKSKTLIFPVKKPQICR